MRILLVTREMSPKRFHLKTEKRVMLLLKLKIYT